MQGLGYGSVDHITDGESLALVVGGVQRCLIVQLARQVQIGLGNSVSHAHIY